ncbi:Inorganic pyrophosphatase TTM2 [Bienertia sinuspersici]
MALGYTIAAILKRNSHVFSDGRVTVKIDWLEQLSRQYIQWHPEMIWHHVSYGTRVQGRDRLQVRSVAEQLGLEGSYIPRTYIEQIQLEKLVKEVMALPEDLKTKLSLDDDFVSSPQDALSRASADRIAWRHTNLKSRGYDERNSELFAMPGNKGGVTQLSDQILTLNDRMDEFTSMIEELSSKLMVKKLSPSQQNMILQSETCNGSAPTSYFISGLSNGSLTGSILPNTSSSSQLNKESPVIEELQVIMRGQRQIMHQLENLCTLFRENLGEREVYGRVRNEGKRKIVANVEPIKLPVAVVLTVAFGALGIALYRTRN